jgi:hypothetical protein
VAVDISVGVVGLKENLKQLNKIAPTLRRQITKDYVQIMQPVVDDVQKLIPDLPPITGFYKVGKLKAVPKCCRLAVGTVTRPKSY